MTLDAAARTHVGRVRTQNEDAFVNRMPAGLFAVIDGMGGQEAGEVAAAITAEVIADVPTDGGLTGETLLSRAMREARVRILAEARANPHWEGMGCVATALRIEDDGRFACFAHVGDTRLYHVTPAGVRQLTTDHVAAGDGKRAVARDLGRAEMAEPWIETGRVRVATGDMLVLCSDGLSDPLGENLVPLLGRLRREAKDADAVVTRLVGEALGHGAPDNVTVIAVRVGQFTRAATTNRWPLVGALIVGMMLAIVLAFGVGHRFGVRSQRPPTALPGSMPASGTYFQQDRWSLPAQARTVVPQGAVFGVRGGEVSGTDWTVQVGDGATLQLDRSVLALRDSFTVELGDKASLVLADTRIETARFVVNGPASATVRLRHTALLLGEATMERNGPTLVESVDVRTSHVAAPIEGAAEGTPKETPKAPSKEAP